MRMLGATGVPDIGYRHRVGVHSEIDHSWNGPTVVFVHGMEDRWASWLPVRDALANRGSTHCLAMPWSGDNGHLWGWQKTPEQWLQEGLAKIDSQRLILVGHSFGASAIIKYVSEAARPMVQGIVLLSPVYRRSIAEFEWDSVGNAAQEVAALMREGLAARYRDRRPDEETLDLMGERVRDRLGPYGFAEFLRTFLGSPFLALENITQDVVVATGTHDRVASLTHARQLAEDIHLATFSEFKGGGHFVMQEQPQLVAQLVEGVRQRCGRRAADSGLSCSPMFPQ